MPLSLVKPCVVWPAPVLLVQREEGYGATFPTLGEVQPEFQDILRKFRAHPSGQHALKCFKLHRGQRVVAPPAKL